MLNEARVKKDYSPAPHEIGNPNRATLLSESTVRWPDSSSAYEGPLVEASTLYADSPAVSDDLAAFLLSSYENLSETRLEHYELGSSHHCSEKPLLLDLDTRSQEFELPSAEFPPLQGSSSLASRKVQTSNARWKISQIIEDLRKQNMLLEQECSQLKRTAKEAQLPTTCVLHKVYCRSRDHTAITRDLPSRFGTSAHLEGQDHILDIGVFVAERKPNLAFLIYKKYTCCMRQIDHPRIENDSVEIICPKFAQYFAKLTQNLKEREYFFPNFKPQAHIEGPFYWYYHRLPQLLAETSKLSEEAKTYLDLFHSYIRRDFGNLYKTVASELKDEVVSCDHVPFIFTPGSILSWHNGKSTETGSLESWPQWRPKSYGGPMFPVCSWSFDGNFCNTFREINRDHCSAFLGKAEGEQIPITSLPCFPIRYASANVRADLRSWGETFWRCRKRKFVTYNGWDCKREEWNVSCSALVSPSCS